MSLLRGNQQPQGPPQMQQPVQKQPETLMQRAIKREKWIAVLCIIFGIFGLLEYLFLGRGLQIGHALIGSIITFIFFTILNFTLIPWMQNIFFRSKQASENFWNQKF